MRECVIEREREVRCVLLSNDEQRGKGRDLHVTLRIFFLIGVEKGKMGQWKPPTGGGGRVANVTILSTNRLEFFPQTKGDQQYQGITKGEEDGNLVFGLCPTTDRLLPLLVLLLWVLRKGNSDSHTTDFFTEGLTYAVCAR